MAGLEFYSGGKLLKFRSTTLSELQRQRAATRPMAPVRTAAADAVNEIEVSLRAQTQRLTNRFHAIRESIVRVMPTAAEPSRGLICGMIPTETVAINPTS